MLLNLSEEISKYINKGDRCLLISENRPEWMISDLINYAFRRNNSSSLHNLYRKRL